MIIMKYDAVIFDLDGTLLNTLEDLADAVNAALKSHDMPTRSLDEVRQFVGNGIRKLIVRAVPEGTSQKLTEDVLAAFRRYYAVHCQDKTVPYEGIEELLVKLKKMGIKTAVVSNKADFAVKELMPVYFPGLIHVAMGENEEAGIKKKPSPEMVWRALELLACGREGALYVGDSDVDVQTAANAGIPCVSVTWGFRGEEFLRRHGAETIIDRPDQLLLLL